MDEIKSSEKAKSGTLYIVSTPIGNDEDITARAIRVLKMCDRVVCEEPKIGARLLHKYNISRELEKLNEQNEFEQTQFLLSLLRKGENLALISDCGTPVFADPGLEIVQQCIALGINMTVVPGVSSIMAAVVRSGFSISSFLYAGFLSRNRDERFAMLKRLSEEERTVILLETPYRLIPVLEAASVIMPQRRVYIGCNLTMPFETHHYGTFRDLLKKFSELNFKGEFVIVFEGDKTNFRTQEKSEKMDLKLAKRIVGKSRNDSSRKPFIKSGRNFNEDRSSTGKGGRNFNEDRSSTGKGRRNYNEDRSSTDKGRRNYNEDRSSTGRGGRNYNEDRSSSDKGRRNYNEDRSSSGKGRRNFNEDRSSSGKGRRNYDDDRSSSEKGRRNFNEDRSSSEKGRRNYNEGRSSSEKGGRNFNKGGQSSNKGGRNFRKNNNF